MSAINSECCLIRVSPYCRHRKRVAICYRSLTESHVLMSELAASQTAHPDTLPQDRRVRRLAVAAMANRGHRRAPRAGPRRVPRRRGWLPHFRLRRRRHQRSRRAAPPDRAPSRIRLGVARDPSLSLVPRRSAPRSREPRCGLLRPVAPAAHAPNFCPLDNDACTLLSMNETLRSRTRVVVTGLGAITPAGQTVDDFWQSLVNGRSGIDYMTLANPEHFACKVAGEVKDWQPTKFIERKASRRMARFAQFMVAAAGQAFEDARMDLDAEDRDRVGRAHRQRRRRLPRYPRERADPLRARRYADRPALPRPQPRQHGRCAGRPPVQPAGLQRHHRYGLRGRHPGDWRSQHAHPQRPRRSRAHGRLRSGNQRARSRRLQRHARPHRLRRPARRSQPPLRPRTRWLRAVRGGRRTRARKRSARAAPAAPASTPKSAAMAARTTPSTWPRRPKAAKAPRAPWSRRSAIPASKRQPSTTSTPMRPARRWAIRPKRTPSRLSSRESAYQVPISATKSLIGHGLGASGGMETVATVKTIETGTIHPTVNLHHPDPTCDLDYVPNDGPQGRGARGAQEQLRLRRAEQLARARALRGVGGNRSPGQPIISVCNVSGHFANLSLILQSGHWPRVPGRSPPEKPHQTRRAPITFSFPTGNEKSSPTSPPHWKSSIR